MYSMKAADFQRPVIMITKVAPPWVYRYSHRYSGAKGFGAVAWAISSESDRYGPDPEAYQLP
jgi:hypothetical protein